MKLAEGNEPMISVEYIGQNLRISIPILELSVPHEFTDQDVDKIDEIVDVIDKFIDGEIFEAIPLPYFSEININSGNRINMTVIINGIEFERASMERFIHDIKQLQLKIGKANFKVGSYVSNN